MLGSDSLQQDEMKSKVSVVGSNVLFQKSDGPTDDSSKEDLSHDPSNDKIVTTGAKLEADEKVLNQTKLPTQTIGNFNPNPTDLFWAFRLIIV